MTLKLFIDISSNTLLASQSSSNQIDSTSLPFFFGDTLNLQVYLLQPPEGFDPMSNSASGRLQTINTSGITLSVYLTDGTVSGTTYTQQLTFTTDTNNTYFSGSLPLNTAGLQTLLGTGKVASAYLKVGATVSGIQSTVLSKPITINVGVPLVSLTVPANQTPLSVEVANATYFPNDPAPGQCLFLTTPTGEKVGLRAVIEGGQAMIKEFVVT